MIRHATAVALDTILIGLVALALALTFLAHGLPALGHGVYVVQSGSMRPTIPVGATVILDRVVPGDLRVGDIVTFRLANGEIFTHRITRLVRVQNEPYVETKGDANEAVDPAVTAVSRVVGRVTLVIPLAGFLMTALGTVTGGVALLSASLTILLALWLLDEGPVEQRSRRTSGSPNIAGISE